MSSKKHKTLITILALGFFITPTFGSQKSGDSWKTNVLLAAGAVGHAAVNLAAQYLGSDNESPANSANENAESPTQAPHADRIAPEEPFNRRYLPNGMAIDSPWLEETVLPTTDHNCALFGIFRGTNITQITRNTVITHLNTIGQADSLLALEIRRLMAYDILAYLMEDEANRLAHMTLLAQGQANILNLLRTVWDRYLADPSESNRNQLLKILQNKTIFSNYNTHVLDKRLGDGEEDPYPTLGYIPGPTPTDGMTGALAAMAAMTGQSINIHQRQGREIVQVAGYIYRGVLAPGAQPHTVDLLHTTADPVEAPNALNHFNLLERTRSIQELTNAVVNLPYELEDPVYDIKCLSNLSNQIFADSKTGYEAKSSKMLQFANKLNFSVLTAPKNLVVFLLDSDLKKYDSQLATKTKHQLQKVQPSTRQTINAPHNKSNDSNETLIYENNTHFTDFPTSYIDHIDNDWAITLKHIINFFTSLNNTEKAAIQNTQILIGRANNRFKNNQKAKNDIEHLTLRIKSTQNEMQDDNEAILSSLNILHKSKPTYRNIQFFIFMIDATLQRRLNHAEQVITTIRDQLTTGLCPLAKDYAETIADNFRNSMYREIAFWRYCLNQLIDFSRTHGIDPVVPHYTPASYDEQDAELMGLLNFTQGSTSPHVTPPQPIEVTISEKATQAPSKKKSATQSAPVINTKPEATSETTETVILPNEEEVVSVELDSTGDIIEGKTEVKEEEPEVDETFDINAQEAYFAELRTKKHAQLTKPKVQRTSVHTTLEEIGALLPQERVAFQAFLFANMRDHERGIYESFITAQNNAITLDDMEQFSNFMTRYLAQFLKMQVYPNGTRMYSDRAIKSFIESIQEGHAKSFHNFHPKKGQKVPSAWIKFRYATWIEHGVLSLEGANRTVQTAHTHYQLILARRMGQ